jgi:hypothetical protein
MHDAECTMHTVSNADGAEGSEILYVCAPVHRVHSALCIVHCYFLALPLPCFIPRTFIGRPNRSMKPRAAVTS